MASASRRATSSPSSTTTDQIDKARDAQAKFDDLGHQVEQKRAQNRADAEKRISDLQQAEADLAKAEIELQKGPVLSEIDRLKNEQKAAIARTHVESLKKSNALHDQADDRRPAHPRTPARPPKSGPRARPEQHGQTRNQGASRRHGRPAEHSTATTPWATPRKATNSGAAQPLVSIFDPSEMLGPLRWLASPMAPLSNPGTKAMVYLDAYPDVVLPAHFEFASPVASSRLRQPHQELHRRSSSSIRPIRICCPIFPPPSSSKTPVDAKDERSVPQVDQRPLAQNSLHRARIRFWSFSCSCSIGGASAGSLSPTARPKPASNPPLRARPQGRFPRHRPLPRRAATPALRSRSTRPSFPSLRIAWLAPPGSP